MKRLKTAHVKFEDSKYNYSTSVNGSLTDSEIKDYFVGEWFNLGHADNDNIQLCIDCIVTG